MKSYLKSTVVVFLIIQLVLMAKPGHTGSSCDEIDSSIAPCIGCLTRGGDPSDECCHGVKTLKDNNPTADDKKKACYCLKDAAKRYNVKIDQATSLLDKCGVRLDIVLRNDMDCDKIN